jgi:hypothetical protein
VIFPTIGQELRLNRAATVVIPNCELAMTEIAEDQAAMSS